MKKTLLTTFSLITCVAMAQNEIPNAGFEDWSGDTPVGWTTANAPGFLTPVTQSTDAAEGSSSARGEALAIPGGSAVLAPVLTMGVGGALVPITQAYEGIRGQYKMQANGSDAMIVALQLYDDAGALVASAEVDLPTATMWTEFELVLDYNAGSSTEQPTRGQIQITIENNSGTATVGSVFHVDDLSFTGGTIGIDESSIATIPMAVWPLPATDELNVTFTLPNTMAVELEVLDATGRYVGTLRTGTLPAGEQRISWHPFVGIANGVYNLLLKYNGNITTKHFVLAR